MQMRPFLPYVAAFRLTPDGDRKVTVMGTALVEFFGVDVTGRSVDEAYREEDHEELRAFHARAFESHYLTYSIRDLYLETGGVSTLEQTLLPVGNAAGVHDRYVLVASVVPGKTQYGDERRDEVFLGELHHRVVYDPATMMPIDCDLTHSNHPDFHWQKLWPLEAESPAQAL